MTTPTGTDRPSTMAMPGRYAPINSMKANSRVPGRGKSYQGDNLPFQGMSSRALGKPALDTGSAFKKVVPDAKGPA